MTVILTTHYLEEVERFAERVVMLKSGVKIHDTTIREMLDSLGEEVYRMEVVRKSNKNSMNILSIWRKNEPIW